MKIIKKLGFFTLFFTTLGFINSLEAMNKKEKDPIMEQAKLLSNWIIKNKLRASDPDLDKLGIAEKNHLLVNIAAKENNEAIVEALIEFSYNVNHKDDSGHTPLMYAAENDNPMMAHILVKKGKADPTITDNDGLTAYDHAVKKGYDGMAYYLKPEKDKKN